MAAWQSAPTTADNLLRSMGIQQPGGDSLIPLSVQLIALPLASAFALPGFGSTDTPAHQPHVRSLHSADTRVPTQPHSSSHRGGERTSSVAQPSSGGMLELSSGGRPSTSTGPTPPAHTGQQSYGGPAISGGQPQLSAGAPVTQPTTSHSQQQHSGLPNSSDQMGSYRAPQPMPTSSYQSGAHSMHMQQMMQAAAAYHMQQQLGQGGMQMPNFQAQNQNPYGGGYNPYGMGPYGVNGPADYAAQQQMYRHLAGAQGSMHNAASCGNNPHSSSHGDDDDDAGARAIKRPRLVWTPQLHKRFEEAIVKLGDAKAVPKNIMQEMNVEGLTRENVASHLQKYRLQSKSGSGNLEGPMPTISD